MQSSHYDYISDNEDAKEQNVRIQPELNGGKMRI
jgi:hypothetical protein